ncbi:MAG: FAD-dependent oxidoreductase [Candidatus Omnitrophota bacterium]
MNEFFENSELKLTFEVLLCNIGISAKKVAALSALIFYRDYILDGGYYPMGGMDEFAKILSNRFVELGGELILNNRVNKICLYKNTIKGVVLSDGKFIDSKLVVSNSDATQTFKDLLADIDTKEKKLVEQFKISPPLFALYLGLDCKYSDFTNETCNMWWVKTNDLDSYYSDLKNNILSDSNNFFMTSFPAAHTNNVDANIKNTMQFFMYAPYENEDFWGKHRIRVEDKLINEASAIFKGFKKNIKVKVSATPLTFNRYTLNRSGSPYGWASTLDQLSNSVFPQKTSINNLYLVGHWCTIGSGQGGVPKVLFSGRKAAYLITKQAKMKWKFKKNILTY